MPNDEINLANTANAYTAPLTSVVVKPVGLREGEAFAQRVYDAPFTSVPETQVAIVDLHLRIDKLENRLDGMDKRMDKIQKDLTLNNYVTYCTIL